MSNLTDEQRDKLREIGRLMKEVNLEIYSRYDGYALYIKNNDAPIYESDEGNTIYGKTLILIADSDKGE